MIPPLQEASCICRGSAGRVMGMASSLRQELWDAVEGADGARYTELSDALDLAPVMRQERRPAVPLRLTLVPSTGSTPSKFGIPKGRHTVSHWNYTIRP